jgi:filamentous hemagglutinin family protein
MAGASSSSQPFGTSRMWRSAQRMLLATSALVPLSLGPVAANPLGGQVVGGNAAISGTGTSTVTVTQTTQNAAINWNTFNIGTGERTQFVQPNSSATVLNRVIGDLGPSQIYGTLSANGRVFLINPNGVVVGNGAVINTASFLATTHDISNTDFMAGRYNFNIPGRPDASIVNMGTITASTGGFAALVAPGVRNSGTITADFGKVALAAGNSFSLDLYGDKLITLAVNDQISASVKDVATGQTLKSLVQNDGKLRANGGRVELTAAAARQVVDSVINNRGVIEARSVGRREGRIVLSAATQSAKPVKAPTQTVKVSGKLDVSGKGSKASNTKGGTIVVSGEAIELAGAMLDASGAAGGGKILIGGDTGGGNPAAMIVSLPQARLESGPLPNASSVSIDSATTINASAIGSGAGGKVVVWSDGGTIFNGAILARGGATSGDGGFVEVSGKQALTFNGKADLGALNGASGTLLLDPQNGVIGTVAGAGVILASAIEQALASGNVFVTTGADGSEPGDLTVASPISWSAPTSLTLSAHRDIIVNADITNSHVSTGPGERHRINLLPDNTGTGVGTVIFGSGATITSGGRVNIAFNSASFAVPSQDYTPNVTLLSGGVLRQFMKVNTPADLQEIATNLSANYMLGRDIDMAGVTDFVPIGDGITPFTGRLTGLDHSISNLTIHSTASHVGLFGRLGDGARVSNLTLVNFDMESSATGGAQVGALAGENLGSIRGVDVLGATIGATAAGAMLGGLSGSNLGKIRDTNAIGITIDIPAISGAVRAGGLVGFNGTSGTIARSFTTAGITSVATKGPVELGLLAGANDGRISKSFAFGAIADLNSQSPPVAVAGGVVGHNGPNGTLEQTYSVSEVIGAPRLTGGVIGRNSNQSATAVTASYWNSDTGPADGIGPGSSGSTTGANPLTTDELAAGLPAGFSAAAWLHVPDAFPILQPKPQPGQVVFQPSNEVAPPPPDPAPPDPPQPPTPLPLNALLPDVFATYANTTFTPPPDNSGRNTVLIGLTFPGGAAGNVANQLGITTIQQLSNALRPGQPGFTPPPLPLRTVVGPDGENRSSVPPPGETRFKTDQVLLQVKFDLAPERLTELLQGLGLQVLASQNLVSLGRVALLLRITDGRSVRDIIRALELMNVVALASPEYEFRLMQSPAGATRGDPAQYVLSKFSLTQAHRVASGKDVIVAVIDSEVDKQHTEIQGAISEELDTLAVKEPPHAHGTAMAGAIVSRARLLGVAPAAKILAVRAFGESASAYEGTSFNILKGIEWAMSQGARVINMSFAGPRDPSLERAFKAARQKGVVLVAAAGNAGPKSAPLYPAADPSVIAVTAVDSQDRVFRGANQGTQVSVSAPGVDILAPAPDQAYQMSTGTSIATAHVSGVVALMLERDPSLSPDEVRRILEATATDLGPKGRDSQFGWGMVNPQKALDAVAARRKTSQAAPAQR